MGEQNMSEERETYTIAPALDLDAIEARANAATPGPWRVSTDNTPEYFMSIEGTDGPICVFTDTAAFIAAARSDVPALVAEVRRLKTRVLVAETRVMNKRAEIKRLRSDVERIGRERDDMARAAQELQELLSAYASRLEDDGK
jgi:hypothetical protein